MCSGYMKGPPRVTECQSRIGGTGRLLEVRSYFEHSACNSCQVVPLFGANSDKDKISHTLANRMAKRPGELPIASHLKLGPLLWGRPDRKVRTRMLSSSSCNLGQTQRR